MSLKWRTQEVEIEREEQMLFYLSGIISKIKRRAKEEEKDYSSLNN